MAEMAAEIERLQKENSDLKAKNEESKKNKVRLQVAKKGGMSIYGLQRMPITLYKHQWVAILNMSDEIKDFLSDHDSEFSTVVDKSE